MRQNYFGVFIFLLRILLSCLVICLTFPFETARVLGLLIYAFPYLISLWIFTKVEHLQAQISFQKFSTIIGTSLIVICRQLTFLEE